MILQSDPALETFREEARTWLEENAPREPRPHDDGPLTRAFDTEWLRTRFEGGWAGIDWPVEFGGRGLTTLEQIVWYEELVRARAPGDGVFEVALAHAGPTLMLRGDAEQKARYLPLIVEGKTPWCQGFSESGAGSDLAAVSTRGTVDGDEIVVSGSKIWTSLAQHADFGELLVRTDASSRYGGLTWLVVDMHSPGIRIRTIDAIDGVKHNSEVFYDEVRIPLENVVGGLNNGWSVAMSTLAAERGPAFLDARLSRIVFVDDLIEAARNLGKLDEAMAERLAVARAHAAALRSMAYYQASTTTAGGQPGPESTAVRTLFARVETETGRLAVDIAGAAALEWNATTRNWLRTFSLPIAGGTKDIHKNIIGERVLGLPK